METFSPKLDVISENIVYLLSLDSRRSISEISRLLSQPRKIIENRVGKLYRKGFIRSLLIYNYQSLFRATIFIKLSHFDKKSIDVIRKISPLIKFKETLGMYDLSLLVMSDKEEDLELIVGKINELFHNSILNLEVIYHDVEDTLGYKSFCHNLNLFNKYNFLIPKKQELNKEEKEILALLKSNPAISYKELEIKAKLGYKKIKEIISHLLENKIIRFSIDPDYTALGLEFHNLLVKVNLAKRREFEQNMIKHSRVHWLKRGTGRWDYILSIGARNISEFIDITRQIKSQNREIIFDSSALVSKINIMRKC
nr:hypothetical protein [uncultured archaeon]